MKNLLLMGLLMVHGAVSAGPPAWAEAAATTAGDQRRLASIYQRALQVDPGNSRIKLELARSYETQGRLQDAFELAQQVRQAGPDDADALLLIGRIEARRQQWPAARDAYHRATRLEPANAAAYLGLGQALQQLSDEEGADRAFDQYLNLIEWQ